MAIEPEQPGPSLTPSGKIDIAQVFATEFGTQRLVIAQQLSAGKLVIDGKVYTDPERRYLPPEAVWGKMIEINGPERGWKMLYKN